jgi:hypothetical protein
MLRHGRDFGQASSLGRGRFYSFGLINLIIDLTNQELLNKGCI